MQYVDLYTDVSATVGNVPLPTVLRHTRNLVRDFCKETRAYTHEYTGLTQANEAIALTPPTNTKVWGVNSVKTEQGNSCSFLFAEDTQIITLVGVSERETNFTVEAVLMPTRAANSCDDKVMDTFFETIVSGVAAACFMMPGADWFNPNLGQAHAMTYQKGKQDAITRKRNDDRQGIRRCSYGGI